MKFYFRNEFLSCEPTRFWNPQIRISNDDMQVQTFRNELMLNNGNFHDQKLPGVIIGSPELTLTSAVSGHHEHFPVGDRFVGAVLDGQHVGHVYSGPHSVHHRGAVSTRHV